MSIHGGSVCVIETLSALFSQRYTVHIASSKKNQILRMIDMLYTIWKYRKNAGILLIDTYSSKAFWYAYLSSRLAKFLNIPYAPFLHGGNFPKRLPELSKYTPKIFGESATNISPSIFLKEAFEKEKFDITYIPNSIPMENYEYIHRSNLKPNILWVRAFEKTYNSPMAIEVLKLVKQKYPEAKLCMIGGDKDGSMITTKKIASDLGLENDVEFTGFMAKPEWIQKSKGYDIFINTTNIDNHPVSVIEAMALGLPVISTNAGGVPYFITNKENGLLCEVGNASQMAEMIIQLLTDSTLASTLSANGRKSAETFDLKEILKKWWNFFDRFIQ